MVRTDLRSGTDHQITSGVFQEHYTALSPDSRAMAFQTGNSSNDLFEIPLNGTVPVAVLASDRAEVAPSWAPDGTHFAYATDRSGVEEIWLRNRGDGSERMIVSVRDFPNSAADDQFLDCAISPDGSRVAYRYADLNPEIWISSLAGDAPVPLFKDPQKVWQRSPSWSPDGNWIAYYSTFNSKPAVLKVRVGGSRARNWSPTPRL